MARMIHTYYGKAKETYDRVIGDNKNLLLNKWYLNRQYGIIYKKNNVGNLHILRPEHYKFNGKVYYRMQGFRLTDADTLVATNYSTPTFRDKEDYTSFLEELTGETLQELKGDHNNG